LNIALSKVLHKLFEFSRMTPLLGKHRKLKHSPNCDKPQNSQINTHTLQWFFAFYAKPIMIKARTGHK
ncbi:hypothetical protein AB4524_18655, partial [Vibrio breoganii]